MLRKDTFLDLIGNTEEVGNNCTRPDEEEIKQRERRKEGKRRSSFDRVESLTECCATTAQKREHKSVGNLQIPQIRGHFTRCGARMSTTLGKEWIEIDHQSGYPRRGHHDRGTGICSRRRVGSDTEAASELGRKKARLEEKGVRPQ